MKSFVFLILLTVSLGAVAGTTDCSSFDSKLNYHLDSPDGGAPRGSIESLAIGDQTLISRSFPGGANIAMASLEFASQPVWSSKAVVKNGYQTVRTLVRATVTKNADKSVIFSDLVFCQAVKYAGRPRPTPNRN